MRLPLVVAVVVVVVFVVVAVTENFISIFNVNFLERWRLLITKKDSVIFFSFQKQETKVMSSHAIVELCGSKAACQGP